MIENFHQLTNRCWSWQQAAAQDIKRLMNVLAHRSQLLFLARFDLQEILHVADTTIDAKGMLVGICLKVLGIF
jgi:hypothetical protein